jgi:hypothetical protein
MATLHGPISFLGTLDKLSAYKMKGSDKIILRRKGGPSKNTIKKSPKFERTRENYTEFGGRSSAAKHLRRIMVPLQHIADKHTNSSLNPYFKPIQVLDEQHERGERSVATSLYPQALEGYSLNSKYLLETIVKPLIPFTLSKEDLNAKVMLPLVMPRLHLYVPGNFSWYRFTAVLGTVPDLAFEPIRRKYKVIKPYREFRAMVETEWFPVKKGSPARDLNLQLPAGTYDFPFSLALVVGISFGNVVDVDHIQSVERTGAGKIMGMV